MITFILACIGIAALVMAPLFYYGYRYMSKQNSYTSKVIAVIAGMICLLICLEMPIIILIGLMIDVAGFTFLDCDVSSYTVSIWRFICALCLVIILTTVFVFSMKKILKNKNDYAKSIKFVLGAIFLAPILLVLVALTATMTYSYIDNGLPPYKPRITTPAPIEPIEPVEPVIVNDFEFLGEKVRKDNFDTTITVTSENIRHLYRSYNVSVLLTDKNDVYYLVESKTNYVAARYLSRIIKMSNNIQTHAVTYYGFYVMYFKQMGNNFLLGLNSNRHSDAYYPPHLFCKIAITDNSLKNVWERQFKYPDQPYTYINKLEQTADGFQAEVVNIALNHPSYHFLYKVNFNKRGGITRSSKQRVAIECPYCDVP